VISDDISRHERSREQKVQADRHHCVTEDAKRCADIGFDVGALKANGTHRSTSGC
jgi:hypothetical protein